MATGPLNPWDEGDERKRYFDVAKVVYLVGEVPLRVMTALPKDREILVIPYRYILCCN